MRVEEFEEAIGWVEHFLDMNYGSCNCGDHEGCPGNYYEATVLVRELAQRMGKVYG